MVGTQLPSPLPPPMGLHAQVPPDSGAAREASAWAVVQVISVVLSCPCRCAHCNFGLIARTCAAFLQGTLDAYAQRCSAAQQLPGEIYDAMIQNGPQLVEAYIRGIHAARG